MADRVKVRRAAAAALKRGKRMKVRMSSMDTAKEFNLAQILDAITPGNLHTGVDLGAPVGRELL